ncbi:hypothetical protein GCM10010404_04660 [Nonomuraea africana]
MQGMEEGERIETECPVRSEGAHEVVGVLWAPSRGGTVASDAMGSGDGLTKSCDSSLGHAPIQHRAELSCGSRDPRDALAGRPVSGSR